jgi:hypothetical protein
MTRRREEEAVFEEHVKKLCDARDTMRNYIERSTIVVHGSEKEECAVDPGRDRSTTFHDGRQEQRTFVHLLR